ncbi:MAG TPA: hypothetical protein VM008_18350 [Phycisphaerae bacterium]|nr:hypothetical protein [Phycisphaerae bacterium]
MFTRKMLLGLVATAAVAAISMAASANSVSFTSVAGSNSDGPLSATITFKAIAGGIDITVVNNETGTIAKGQSVSALSFGISGISLPTGFTEMKGETYDPSSGTSWTLASGTSFDTTGSSPINHWGFGVSGSTVTLATAGSGAPGGNPHYLILGSTGTAGSGSSLANSNFYPYVIGPADFILTDSSITAGTVLLTSNFTGLTVGFGTGPDTTLNTNPNGSTIPLPAAFWSGISLLGALGIGASLRKKLAH